MIDITLKQLICFFMKIKQTNACWEWIAYKDKDGYGKFTINQYSLRTHKPYMAHRISYELFIGEIPTHLQIDHLCRNRSCVNPNHLELVTIKQNVLRGIGLAAMNVRKTQCPRGHELKAPNLIKFTSPKHGRVCKFCHDETHKRYVENKKKVNGHY